MEFKIDSSEMGHKVGSLYSDINKDFTVLDKVAVSLEALDSDNVSSETCCVVMSLLSGGETISLENADASDNSKDKAGLIKKIMAYLNEFIKRMMIKVKKYLSLIITSNKMLTKKIESLDKKLDALPNAKALIDDKYGKIRDLAGPLMGEVAPLIGANKYNLVPALVAMLEYGSVYKRFIPEYEEVKTLYSASDDNKDASKLASKVFTDIPKLLSTVPSDVITSMTKVVQSKYNSSKGGLGLPPGAFSKTKKFTTIPVEANSKRLSGLIVNDDENTVFYFNYGITENGLFAFKNKVIGNDGEPNILIKKIVEANKTLDTFKDNMKKDIDEIEDISKNFKKDMMDEGTKESINSLNKAIVNLSGISAKVAMANVNNLFQSVKDCTYLCEHMYSQN